MNAEPESNSSESEEAFATLNSAPRHSIFHKPEENKVDENISAKFKQPTHSFISEEVSRNEH